VNIAIITEGVSEYRSIPLLYPQLNRRSGNRIVATMRVNVSPLAPDKVIAHKCAPLLVAAKAKSAERVVVLLDREQRDECAGDIASSLEFAISARSPGPIICVVLKDRTYENWLLADVDALAAQPGRFRLTQGLVKAVQPDRADSCTGIQLLGKAAIKVPYSKVEDSVRICRKMDLGRASQHSRSLRRFLRIIDDAAYLEQSRLPVS